MSVKQKSAVQSKQPERVLIFICLFAVVGLVMLYATRAAGNSVSIEAEAGTLSSPAQSIPNANASGGSVVKFKSATSACPASTTKVCWNGKLWFLNGVNMPWYNWGSDFGGNNSGGVMATKADIAVRLAQLKDSGTHMVRWWMFEGDAWQIGRDSSNMPTALNTAVYADIDAALTLANTYDLYYNFTLFNAANSFPATWRSDPAQRAKLGQVLAPLFARYKDNPRVMSWEIFNEPEWQIWNDSSVKQDDVKNMARAIISQIRSNSPGKLVTVGQALITGIPMWTDVDLDYYSPHWYDIHTGADENALGLTTAGIQSKYGTNKPILLGEYYQGGGTAQQNVDRQNQLYTRGYAGGWGWSLFYDHTSDNLKVDFSALKTFNAQHSDVGPQ